MLQIDEPSGMRERGSVLPMPYCALSVVEELSAVHALHSSDRHSGLLEVVGVLELDLGNRGTTAAVMDDVPHDTLDVTLTLGKVESVVSHRALAKTLVGSKY